MDLRIEEIKDQFLKQNYSFLEEIYLKNHSFCITNIGRKFGLRQEDCEDIYSDSILVVRKNILRDKLDNLDSMRNYIFTICCNLASSSKRKIDKENQIANDFSKNALAEDENEKELAENRLAHVEQGLEALSEKCKKIMLYFYRDGASLSTISRLMGYSSENVAKNAKHRCLKKLIELIP